MWKRRRPQAGGFWTLSDLNPSSLAGKKIDLGTDSLLSTRTTIIDLPECKERRQKQKSQCSCEGVAGLASAGDAFTQTRLMLFRFLGLKIFRFLDFEIFRV